MIWNNNCQVAFGKIKSDLLNPPVLVPPVPGRLLIMYLAIHETSMGCMLGQHDEFGKKEQAIYCLSKKFADYESWYSSLEKTYSTLIWPVQRLHHYMLYHTTTLISQMDPLKYLFKKPTLSGGWLVGIPCCPSLVLPISLRNP